MDPDDDCIICFENITEKQLYTCPQCNGRYHIECCDKWKENSDNCPSCRRRYSIISDDYKDSKHCSFKKSAIYTCYIMCICLCILPISITFCLYFDRKNLHFNITNV